MPRAHHPIFDPAERELTEGGFAREEVRLANRNPGTLLGLHWRGWRFEWQPTPVVRCEGHLRALRDRKSVV